MVYHFTGESASHFPIFPRQLDSLAIYQCCFLTALNCGCSLWLCICTLKLFDHLPSMKYEGKLPSKKTLWFLFSCLPRYISLYLGSSSILESFPVDNALDMPALAYFLAGKLELLHGITRLKHTQYIQVHFLLMSLALPITQHAHRAVIWSSCGGSL